jgi:hypothetical protein
MKPFNTLMLLLSLVLTLPAQTTEPAKLSPVRLAIVSEESALRPAADFLTAELSKDGRLALLERDQIARVFNEQALALAAGGSRNYIKLGELLGADGLLILTQAEKEDRQVASCRLVAVKPGVELGLADYDFPLSDPEQWSKLMAGQFSPLLPKLTVLRQDAVPISILNLRSAAASPEGEILERQLTLLLHDRLMTEKALFVLERRSMETLAGEKEAKPVTENPFWSGSYLIEGTIDPQGFNSNSVTVDIQITPPDKKNVITLEVSGARSNLTQVINDLALRIAGTVSKGSLSGKWSADDEAERYFEEAKWMLHWGMSQEAKAASEAAWALGKQTLQSAELRIQAYQACAGDPGTCMVIEGHVSFTRQPREGIMGVNGDWEFASIPPAGGFSASIRAADLWLDGLRRFSVTENKSGSSWYNLGATNLEQCSWWLRYFYFTVEARSGAGDDIRHARQLCREMSQALALQVEGEPLEALLRIVAKHEVFWAETPEETLRSYHEFLDRGQWPGLRKRFFNDAYKEVSALRKSQGYTFTTRHKASESADECSPCLAGWDWKTRQRCPDLWRGFIDELCASPKLPVQLEGLVLRCSYSWSDAEFKSNLSRLEEFIRQQLDTLADAGIDKNLARDLQTLVDIRAGVVSVEGRDPEKDRLWNAFKRELEEAGRKRMEHAAQDANLKVKAQYLQTRTNFDFMSFSGVLLNNNFNAEEARFLLPLVTNYHERIKNLPPKPVEPGADQTKVEFDKMVEKSDRETANYWFGQLESRLKAAISPLPPRTNSSPTTPSLALHPPGSFHGMIPPQNVFLPGGGNPPEAKQDNRSAAKKPLSSIKSIRFWKMPAEKGIDPAASYPGHVSSAFYRDGTLWFQELYSTITMSGWSDFYGVNLKTFTARHVAFRGDQFTFWTGREDGGEHRFDVDSKYLYLWTKDSVCRYSFQRQTWEPFAAAGGGRPHRLGARLFFTSTNSICEYLPDGTVNLLASCRRRPAVTVLDNLGGYAPCHLFLDGKGRINLCASNELYVLSGSNDWQLYATVPTADYSGATLFENGFILPGREKCWGMFAPCQKPELLFLQASQPEFIGRTPAEFIRRAQSASQESAHAPRWLAPPPAREACLVGDCVWFLFNPAQHVRTPGFSPRSSDYGSALSLVRFKYGEPDPMTIAIDLSQQQPDPRQASANILPFNNPFSLGRWSLTATPQGLVTTRGGTPGFWFISSEVLNQAVDEAYAHHSANP